jgi:hypothetical protein
MHFQVDRMNEEGLSGLVQRVSALSYGYEGRLELHLIGAFADPKGVAAALVHSALSKPFILEQRQEKGKMLESEPEKVYFLYSCIRKPYKCFENDVSIDPN